MPDHDRQKVRVMPCAFEDAEAAIRAVRYAVFTLEQGVAEAIDFDGTDPPCRHVVAYDAAGTPIGTGRVLPDGHLGRIAVLAEWRGRGIGGRITEALIEAARGAGHKQVALNAQTHACGFYERLGFEARGERFIEADIEHVEMVMAIA